MNKRDATIKARQGVTAGDLRAILNAQTYITGMSTVNKAFPKSAVWSIFHASIANVGSDEVVEVDIARNIMWEFAPSESTVKE